MPLDILKSSNVAEMDRDPVFQCGLNCKYPSLAVLLARSHLYKATPGFHGNPFKSKSRFSIIDWENADEGLKKAVEEVNVPFDSTIDVLVSYNGFLGTCIMLLMESPCFVKHLLNQEASCRLNDGDVKIQKQASMLVFTGWFLGSKMEIARKREVSQ
jgi:hypothetical protein